jgi:protein-tyrosine phosphatase
LRNFPFLSLKGGLNFRDIGGYLTEDGRTIARGRVFRSGSLARVTEDDRQVIEGLGLRLILDFRATPERLAHPSRLPRSGNIEIWARDHDSSSGNLVAALSRPGNTAERSHRIMMKVYRNLAYEQADSYRELFIRLASRQFPILFHCSFGKDRTGIAAALLLDVLGVPRDVIVGDYTLTDTFFQEILANALEDLGGSALERSDQNVWAPMLRAHADYIEAFFAAITAEHGSAEAFLTDVLKLSPAMLDALREGLLIGNERGLSLTGE